MESTILRTERLEMVGCTPELLHADGEGNEQLAARLRTRVPTEWPPELYDDDARRWTLDRVESQPESEGWWTYYLVRDPGTEDGRELVGLAGYKGPPSDDGTVEVGYGVLPSHQRVGYATEATAALVRRAFSFPQVTRVIAETLPELAPSIGVLEKSGFTLLEGEGSEPGVIRFELRRGDWERRRGASS